MFMRLISSMCFVFLLILACVNFMPNYYLHPSENAVFQIRSPLQQPYRSVLSPSAFPFLIHSLTRYNSSKVTETSSIYRIYSDADFAKYNITGSGTADDPYLLANQTIFVSDPLVSAFYIANITKHFILENITVEGGRNGIILENITISTVRLVNVTIVEAGNDGVVLYDTVDVQLKNVTVTTVGKNGISVVNSSNIKISHARLEDNAGNGIEMYAATTFTVNSTFLRANTNGMVLFSAAHGTILQSEVEQPLENGIVVSSSQNITIHNTTVFKANKNGVQIVTSNDTVLTANQIEENHEGMTVLASPQTALRANHIKDNTLRGVYIIDSPNTTLMDNRFYSNGLTVSERYKHTYLSYRVANNTVNDKPLGWFTATTGLVIDNRSVGYGQLFLIDVNASVIQGQVITATDTGGIILLFAHDIQIKQNRLNQIPIGIWLQYSSAITVTQNSLIQSRITLAATNTTFLTFNNVTDASPYAITLEAMSAHNVIHHNNLVANYKDAQSQALDNGFNNTWYDSKTKEGNYWSNWSGTGVYNIDGTAHAYDPYPLLQQSTPSSKDASATSPPITNTTTLTTSTSWFSNKWVRWGLLATAATLTSFFVFLSLLILSGRFSMSIRLGKER